MSLDPDRRQLLRATIGTTAVLPVTLTARDTARTIRNEGLSARDLGARFDGRSDDAAALQRGIDEAARTGRPLVLPSGTAGLSRPLDLKGRHVAILGDPAGHTVLRAVGSLTCLIDAQEAHEVIDSALYLFGLTLDGAGKTAAGINLRYRHRTFLDTLTVGGCMIGIDERDAWLARRINCRVRGNATGWRLRGANHSSVWIGCSFSDARDVHLDIGVDGTAQDGNDALLFQACDVEYGTGDGIRVASGATATFDTCYLGEAIGGDVLRTAGTVLVRGGVLFVGYGTKARGIVPLGGRTTVTDASVRGQEQGTLDRLAGCDVPGASGRVVFREIDMQLKVGGDPLLHGDILGTLPMRVLAPLHGRNWQASANDTEIIDDAIGDTRSTCCRAATGPNPLIGLAASLHGQAEARRDGPAYVVIVYAATRPVELKFSGGAIGRMPERLVGLLPATRAPATYVKVDVPVEFARFSTVELIMPGARPGDVLTLHHATIADAAVLEPAPLANLARAR
ncbi:glycoside hydrolase family 55 protein [Sphingomonas phyllosphaerae]|uniref:glycoside hydrolase family 55 protein n=1 Tax=Sphingomonas phyllosphaerae TaxID=257003 RepID=UPI001E3A8F01|nr:glycoside hydrolase family 55 protein [Sphingomonas phyllosphaerae]